MEIFTELVMAVVSIGHFAVFDIVLVPLEYIQTLPPHSTYVIALRKDSTDLFYTNGQSTLLAT